jgi:heat-inducible transcriptional repressor
LLLTSFGSRVILVLILLVQAMHNLTQRQIEILRSIIEEYIDSAEPVGSETIEKKHNLSASPATIRNEMVKLSEYGYLKKPHSSAGRIPTAMGMKFYVRELMKEKELSTVEEVALKEKVWDYRERMQRFLKETTRSLAEKTNTLAIATTNDGNIYCSGYANILEMPEFYDIDVTKTLLEALDEYESFASIFANSQGEEDIHVLIEDELGSTLKGPYGFIFTEYTTPMNVSGRIGVLGPARLKYTSLIPTVRYFSVLIETSAKGW